MQEARNFTTNAPKVLDLKSSSEQVFSKNCRWVPLMSVQLKHVNFNHINKIEVVELKRDRGSTLMRTCDISCIASVLFADVNFTQVYVHTNKYYATVEIHPYCLLRVSSD